MRLENYTDIQTIVLTQKMMIHGRFERGVFPFHYQQIIIKPWVRF